MTPILDTYKAYLKSGKYLDHVSDYQGLCHKEEWQFLQLMPEVVALWDALEGERYITQSDLHNVIHALKSLNAAARRLEGD